MNEAADMSALATILVSVLVVVGAAFTLVGTLGLVRLDSFYQRIHAPTLGTTLGTVCIAVASMICFTATGTRPAIHQLMVIVFITVTTPVGLVILVRAALFRDGSRPPGADPAPDGR
ncbi:monovalent cation/H(+) antiporter subunit G [Enhydrobacter sp.]|jgi:multicomponent K+:H+ antiporter subunit G|uniref:monovalent cation/H(+) antiporter subunit G n=1 Tax=Enhydrobacter sp. TaxID=1894999 RepID=UPI00261FCEDE|nr:monovalent cation/H(+) antiporter subunit G [Enhydrobacter sp.]WIM09156.1 MAG: Na(+) H(+) antiporter subunit G [Enhydrobacter sp.]